MSLTREDKLREMELLPAWKLRHAGEAACATVAQAASPAKPHLIQGIHDRGYLPHLKAQGGIYFVTFRLADSLPQDALAALESLPDEERNRAVENWLDQGHGNCVLKDPTCAAVLMEAIQSGAEKEYTLYAWCVMPNHVHVVLEPCADKPLSESLQRIKSWSAHEINRLSGRDGMLWQRESYDHLVRDDDDFARCCEYVRQNPVKARLVKTAVEYRYGDSFGVENAGEAACATVAQAASPALMGWQELQQTVVTCQACALAQTRTQTVFGAGDPNADWLFVGEAPGAEEDKQGQPFVGTAGQLLDNMLAAIQLKRGANVYIANVLKCRPPQNRDPQGEEVVKCDPYLKRQVALIQPKLIIALGKVAAQSLLGGEQTLGAMRGKLHDHHGVPVIVTYHPAYLLRSLNEKAKAWEDLCFARATMRKFQGGAL